MKNKIKVPDLIWLGVIAVYIVALILATFFDYEISLALADMEGGQYLSQNAFGVFFEIIGESPLYLVSAPACIIFYLNCARINKKPLAFSCGCLAFVGSVIAFTLLVKRTFKYIMEHTDNIIWYEENSSVVLLMSILMATALSMFLVYLMAKIDKEKVKKLLGWAFVVLFTVAISQIVVQGVKVFMGRQRFRTIYVLKQNGLEELVDYTKWFVVNGSRKPTNEMLALGIAKDGYKSFPSGHTCSAAVITAICLIPKFLDLKGKKGLIINLSTYFLAYGFTILVALSRVIMGAHYLSDVLIGGGVTVIAVFVSKAISNKILGKNQR